MVIGGDAAGMSAASQIRRRQPDREVVVLEKGNFTSYSACGIPYHVSGAVETLDDLVARTPQEFRPAPLVAHVHANYVIEIDLLRVPS